MRREKRLVYQRFLAAEQEWRFEQELGKNRVIAGSAAVQRRYRTQQESCAILPLNMSTNHMSDHRKAARKEGSMAELKYKFTNDILFKMMFVKHQDLLKQLVAELLGIGCGSISEFKVTNSEIPPEALGDKFCHLDINMEIDGRFVSLEIQVQNESDYPERSLFYWARQYSSGIAAGGDYQKLPQTIVISILDFLLFECKEYRSEFLILEKKRHASLTDKFALVYYELPKLSVPVNAGSTLELWLSLFKAKTSEDIQRIETMEVPVMNEVIEAYRSVASSPELREVERLRELARYNEASALRHERQLAEQRADKKWQAVVAEKDSALAEKDSALAEKDALIARLQAQLAENGRH